MELNLKAKVDLWREKVLAGTITDDELRQAIAALREARSTAAVRGKERAATKVSRTADELLDALDKLE